MGYSHAEMYGDLLQMHRVDDVDIPKLARIVVTDNFLSVEKIYSKRFDLETYGYSDEEIEKLLHDPDATEQETKTVRGCISDFTKASQRRLIESCSRWQPLGAIGMLTLTYGTEFPDGENSRAFFKAFKERMRRERPEWSGNWKLEYQRRGAPHYHMVLDTGELKPNWKAHRQWVQKTWNEVIGTFYQWWDKGRHMGQARTEFKKARNNSRAKYYLTKELGKMVQSSKEWRDELDTKVNHVGRFWGWHNRTACNFQGSTGYVPSVVGVAILKAMRSLHLKTMFEKGQIKYEGDTPYFSNSGLIVSEEYLPAWRYAGDGHYLLSYLMEAASLELGYDVSRHFVLSSDGVLPNPPPSPPR